MGTLVGHVAPGLGFLVIGLWHLLNHVKLHAQNPNSYKSNSWFPASTSKNLKYLELFLIMSGCTASIAMELFIGPKRHQPFDHDLTIPSNHLHNFEHSTISLTFFLYSLFAIVFDKIAPKKTKYSLTQLLASAAFGQQFLIFHLHSADHMGVEGQYHLLLQLVISITLFTTLLGIGYPKSFLVSFVRSISIVAIGVWLVVMGFMLWTPGLIPKGCFMNLEEGHKVVRCHNDESLDRAKSLVNMEFSWYMILVILSSMCLYLYMVKIYGEKVEYQSLSKYELGEEDEEENGEDVEAQKKIIDAGASKSFVQMGKGFAAMDIER